jgi:hypothetical protein
VFAKAPAQQSNNLCNVLFVVRVASLSRGGERSRCEGQGLHKQGGIRQAVTEQNPR